MSVKNTETVTCPQCSGETEMTVWSSVNVTLDPELKQELYEGKINRFVCAHCGFEENLLVPFLYHDMDKHYCVQYYPGEYLKKPGFFSQFERDASVKLQENVGFQVPEYMLKLHIVFDMNELVKYVLFRELLEDSKQNSELKPSEN